MDGLRTFTHAASSVCAKAFFFRSNWALNSIVDCLIAPLILSMVCTGRFDLKGVLQVPSEPSPETALPRKKLFKLLYVVYPGGLS